MMTADKVELHPFVYIGGLPSRIEPEVKIVKEFSSLSVSGSPRSALCCCFFFFYYTGGLQKFLRSAM